MEILEENASKEHGDFQTVLVAALKNFDDALSDILLNVLLLNIFVLR
jgi:hypothetical protein